MKHTHDKFNRTKTKAVANNLIDKPIQNKGIKLQDNRPHAILQRKANNTGLPDNLKSGIENLSGHSMDDVKVHYNSDKPAQLNAHAYAQGTDIHIANGQEKHLPHEAWHVVQQKQGRVKPTMQMKGKVNVNDDAGLEKEADLMGGKAIQMKTNSNPSTAAIEEPKSAFIKLMDHQKQVSKFEQPVQRALNNKLLKGYSSSKQLVGQIALAILNYNQEIRSKTEKAKINELNTLQTFLLRWFDQNKDGDLDENPLAVILKKVLNDVQGEHQKVINSAVKKGDANSEPPVAGFDALPQKMQAKVKAVWQDLIKGTGNITITEQQDYTSNEDKTDKVKKHNGFQIEALAAFARILETEFGRDLLIRANQNTNGKRQISIRPGNSLGEEDIPSEEFIAKGSTNGVGELKEIKPADLYGNKVKGSNSWKKVQNYLKKFPTLTIPNDASSEERIQLIHDAPKKFSGKNGYRIKTDSGWKYFEFNAGTGSEIVFTRDIHDSSDHSSSRFIDKDGNEIIVPVFITLAHELGHALHFLEGNAVGDVTNTLKEVTSPNEEISEWSNLEEIHTIKGVENNVRKNANSTDRFSHHNLLSHMASVIRTGPLESAYNTADKLNEPAKRHVEALLNDVNTALGERNIKLAKKLLEQAKKLTDEATLALQQEKQADEKPKTPAKRSLFNFWPFK